MTKTFLRLIQGDCLQVLPTLAENSVDSIVCDPPYGLSEGVSVQGLSQRVYNALHKVGFPDLYKRHAEFLKGDSLASIARYSAALRIMDGAIGIEAGIGVPKSTVDFHSNGTIDQEVHNGNVSSRLGIANGMLADKIDAEVGQFLGDFILQLGDVSALSLAGNVPDSCLAEAFFGGFAMPIFASLAPSLPCSDTGCMVVIVANEDVGIGDDALSVARAAPCIVTLPRTVNTLMLRFDLSGRPIELLATQRASHLATIGTYGGAQLVRAFPAASGLASVAEPHRVRFVALAAGGTYAIYFFHLWVPRGVDIKGIIPRGGFMGKEWDATLPDPQVWRECMKVAKPGAMMAVFGGTRTWHRLTVDIENAGWELRDVCMWLHGQGFPKGKGQLKPAWEPVILARKPLSEPTIAANVLAHGCGAINVDACRIGVDGDDPNHRVPSAGNRGANSMFGVGGHNGNLSPQGRWPANLILDEEAAALLDEQSGERPASWRKAQPDRPYPDAIFPQPAKDRGPRGHGDTGGASRFFYVAKASKRDRDEGLEGMPKRSNAEREGRNQYKNGTPLNGSGQLVNGDGHNKPVSNFHPTVKPTTLMRWLVRLVTPPGGTVLDPFMGSGSTGKAAVLEGFSFIGIDTEAEYLEIAEKRIEHARASMQLPLLEVA